MRVRTAGLRCAFLAVTLVSGCKSVIEGSKEQFATEFTCPVERVEAHARHGLYPSDLEPGGDPPPDVAADPVRLTMWRDQQHKARAVRRSAGDEVIEVAGCGHHVLYTCHRVTGKTSWNHPIQCSAAARPPSLAPWLTFATLPSAALDDAESMVAPPIVGSYHSFDVVDNYDWAASIATTWRPDARLYRLEEHNVPMDGRADLASPGSKASVNYWFYSRSQSAVDLRIDVSPYQDRHPESWRVDLQAYPNHDSTPPKPLSKPRCSVEQAVSAVRSTGVLDHATDSYRLNVSLVDAFGGASWNVLFSNEGMPNVVANVNATSCAVEHAK